MGDLLLCSLELAAMPYYIEEASINIYSLEELCYLMEHAIFIPEESFFEEDFFLWIEHEIGEKNLAERLRDAARKEQKVTQYFEILFQATDYLSKETKAQVLFLLQQIQSKSVFERRKMRADRYLENKKYVNAILEYRRLLQMEEECRKNVALYGNILHNIGTAFARLFLFEQAKECFLSAYSKNGNMESVYAAMAACRYLGNEEELKGITVKYGISEEEERQLRETWTHISRCSQIASFESKINQIFEENMVPLEDNEKLLQILDEWKKEYQKSCG